MLVHVHMRVLLQRSPERADAETNDHHRDAKLQPPTNSFRDRNAQAQHDRGDNK